MAGHGIMTFFEGHHEHEIEESFFSIETALGIGIAVIFIAIWQLPMMRKWVPCTHEHCHTEAKISHLAAIGALCFHFFPEAEVRSQLLSSFSWDNFLSIAGIIGFGAHFLVDVIVAIILSLYFQTPAKQLISFICISAVWFLALFSGDHLFHAIPESAEGLAFLFSAFVMAMFIHMPHKVVHCGTCEK
jgi:hypothetical protein